MFSSRTSIRVVPTGPSLGAGPSNQSQATLTLTPNLHQSLRDPSTFHSRSTSLSVASRSTLALPSSDHYTASQRHAALSSSGRNKGGGERTTDPPIPSSHQTALTPPISFFVEEHGESSLRDIVGVSTNSVSRRTQHPSQRNLDVGSYSTETGPLTMFLDEATQPSPPRATSYASRRGQFQRAGMSSASSSSSVRNLSVRNLEALTRMRQAAALRRWRAVIIFVRAAVRFAKGRAFRQAREFTQRETQRKARILSGHQGGQEEEEEEEEQGGGGDSGGTGSRSRQGGGDGIDGEAQSGGGGKRGWWGWGGRVEEGDSTTNSDSTTTTTGTAATTATTTSPSSRPSPFTLSLASALCGGGGAGMVARALSPLSTSGTRRYPSMITPYLLLGDVEDAGNTRVLKALGVTHVLNAAGSLAPPPGHTTAFMYLHLPLEDTPGQSLEAALVEAVAFIGGARECGGLVLVHCAMGISRSVSCALAFLTHPGGGNMPLAAAATLVMARRPIAMPNSGFRTQLALWEVECRGRSSVAVLEGVSAMWDVREWRTHPVRLREVAVKEGEAEEREKLGWWGRWWGGDAGKGGGGAKGKGVAPTLPSSSASSSSIYSSRSSTSSSTR